MGEIKKKKKKKTRSVGDYSPVRPSRTRFCRTAAWVVLKWIVVLKNRGDVF